MMTIKPAPDTIGQEEKKDDECPINPSDDKCRETAEIIRQRIQAAQELYNPSPNRFTNGGV